MEEKDLHHKSATYFDAICLDVAWSVFIERRLVAMNSVARNVRLYPWYIFFRDCLFWGPAFFLYFTSVLPLSQALWLESIYYISVAVLEVPSGYASDRLGRKPTLLLSALSLTIAYVLFFLGGEFWVFATAQVLLALGFACASGTDTALHFESLKALGREDEYVAREARALKYSFVAGAVGALAGGALAMKSFELVYAASALAGVAAMGTLALFGEPATETKPSVQGFVRLVPQLLRKSWGKNLRFFMLFSVAMTMMVHFPYEFYQPYLERLTLPETFSATFSGGNTPLVTGVHLAATMLLGSWSTRFVVPLRNSCSIRYALLGCLVFQVVLVGLMALLIHPAVAVLLLSRTASKAISTPIVNGEVAPQLVKSERGTYLSIQSLLGRLCYGGVLIVMPLAASFFSSQFQGVLVSAFVVGLVLLGIVYISPFPNRAAVSRGNPHQTTVADKAA